MKTCRRCHETKPASAFHRCKANPDGLQYWCTDCQRKYLQTNKPVRRRLKPGVVPAELFGKVLCSRCKVRPAMLGTIGRYRKTPVCSRCNHSTRNKRRQELRERLFDHYGRQCVYCGSVDDLQLDHVDGDGRQWRKLDPTGTKWLIWLDRNGYPPACQTTCRRCNSAKQQMTDKEFRAWIARMYHHLFDKNGSDVNAS